MWWLLRPTAPFHILHGNMTGCNNNNRCVDQWGNQSSVWSDPGKKISLTAHRLAKLYIARVTYLFCPFTTFFVTFTSSAFCYSRLIVCCVCCGCCPIQPYDRNAFYLHFFFGVKLSKDSLYIYMESRREIKNLTSPSPGCASRSEYVMKMEEHVIRIINESFRCPASGLFCSLLITELEVIASECLCVGRRFEVVNIL